MRKNTTTASAATEVQMADLDAQLAELGLASIDTDTSLVLEGEILGDDDTLVLEEDQDEANEIVFEEHTEAEEGSMLAAIADEAADAALSAAKQKLYEAQEGTGGIAEGAPQPLTVPDGTEAVKKVKAAGTPRVRMDIGSLGADSFVLTVADADGDLEANKLAVLALRPSAKKIAEKFDNLFVSLANGKKPSAYTVVGYKALVAGTPLSSSDMIKAMEAAGYSLGTARSQAQQIIALFQTVKIATKSEGKLVLNPGSVLAMALNAVVATAGASETEEVEPIAAE